MRSPSGSGVGGVGRLGSALGVGLADAEGVGVTLACCPFRAVGRVSVVGAVWGRAATDEASGGAATVVCVGAAVALGVGAGAGSGVWGTVASGASIGGTGAGR